MEPSEGDLPWHRVGEKQNRRAFLEAAALLAVPAIFLLCQTEPEAVRERLGNRRGDVSDADWSIFARSAERWEEAGPLIRQVLREVRTGRTPWQALAQALEVLREFGLWD